MSTGVSGPIDGVWQLVRAELDGDPAHELLVDNTVLEFKAGTYTVRYAGETADQGTVELGSGTDPASFLLRGQSGPNAGKTIPCIYQRVGERLRVCYGLDGVPPTRFSTAIGEQRYLAVYRFLNREFGD